MGRPPSWDWPTIRAEALTLFERSNGLMTQKALTIDIQAIAARLGPKQPGATMARSHAWKIIKVWNEKFGKSGKCNRSLANILCRLLWTNFAECPHISPRAITPHHFT